MKNNKFGSNKFRAREGEAEFSRKINTRTEKNVGELPRLLFSFKDFDTNQIPPGQSYNEWQEDKLLAYAIEKFGHICKLSIAEAITEGFIKVYGDFPNKSGFKRPQHIVDQANWAVIMNIKGQKGRIAGHIIDNIFYVVFLDKNHKFYPSEKKNT